jgi:hypothetical protein
MSFPLQQYGLIRYFRHTRFNLPVLLPGSHNFPSLFSSYPVLQRNYALPAVALESASQVGDLASQRVDQLENIPQRALAQRKSFRENTRVRQLQLGDHRAQTRDVGLPRRRGPAELVWEPLLLCWACQFAANKRDLDYAIDLPKRLLTYLTGATPVVGSPIVLK